MSTELTPLVFRLLPNGRVGVSDFETSVQGGLSWVHLDGWDPKDILNFLTQTLGVDASIAEDLAQFRYVLRFDHGDGRAAAVLPTVQIDPETPAAAIILICRENLLLTASCEPSPFVEGLLQEWVDDPEGIGTTAPCLLCSLIHALAVGDADEVDKLHDQIELLEDRLFEMKTFEASKAVAIKRDILEERRRLAQIRDFVSAVTRHGEPWAGKEHAADYLDISSQILRQIESLDLARDILASVMDAQLGIISNRLNEVMRVLTVISTVMMAASLIAGIYGMNFAHLPGSTSNAGFYVCLAAMAGVSAMILAAFKRKGFL